MNKLFQTITCSNDDLPQNGRMQSMPNKETSKLVIQDMELMASIGVYEQEKQEKQRVIISIEAELTHKPNTSRDEIADILSYDDIIQSVEGLIDGRHIHLVETLAEEIAQNLLAMQNVKACKISVQKPDIYNNIGGVGVEITRY